MQGPSFQYYLQCEEARELSQGMLRLDEGHADNKYCKGRNNQNEKRTREWNVDQLFIIPDPFDEACPEHINFVIQYFKLKTNVDQFNQVDKMVVVFALAEFPS